MKSDKRLLWVGIASVLIGLLGMSASIGMNGEWGMTSGGWPGFQHGGMMSWWGGSAQDGPAPPVVAGAEDYEIVAADLFFEPSQLTIPAETAVNIRLANDGRVFHDLTIPALDFHLNADPGQTAIGGLEGLAPGEYQFECTVPGHAQAGMVGSLIVEG